MAENLQGMADNHEMQSFQRPPVSSTSSSRHLEDIFRVDNSANHVTHGFVQPAGEFSADDTGPHHVGWKQDNDIHGHHRTTSVHKNAYVNKNVAERTNPRNIEERRKWVQQSGTSGRAPLLEHAQKIVKYMEQDSSLMEASPDSEQLRQEALRDMPQSLAVKKIIKRRLMTSVDSRTKSLSCGKMMKYRISIWFSQMKTGLRNVSYTFELWYSSIKTIEGNFGSGISTYFKFLRWLFLLNVLIALICFGFVVVPQIVYQVNSTPDANGTQFAFSDIFTGSGYIANTILFYGFYTNEYVEGVYSMPIAYFLTMVIIYIGTFVILSISMAKSYRRSFIETKGGLKNVYAHKIFCGWDYSIATIKAANLRSNAIYHELQEVLNDMKYDYDKVSSMNVFLTYTMQLIMNLFIFALLGATGFVMWLLLEQHRQGNDDEDGNSDLVAILTAVFINIIMVLFPIVFRYIARYEDYKTPRVTLYITLFRIFLLEIVVIGVLIVYWLTYAEKEVCWETSIGQEVYRLIIFDFFFSILLVTLFETIRYYVYKNFSERVGEPEFDIARNALSVIYNETLFWVGFLFSPLLGVIVVLKLFLTWYIRTAALMKFCVPSAKSWRAAQIQTWFQILTFLCLLLVLGTLGYVMINIPVSQCGPFRDFVYIHEVFSFHILNVERGSAFWLILSYIGTPGVVALVLIGMSMLVYYLHARTKAQVSMVDFLRGRLILAAKDKEFLLDNISRVTKGQWHYILQEGRCDVLDPRTMAPSGFIVAQSQDSAGSTSSLPASESSSHSGLLHSSNRRY